MLPLDIMICNSPQYRKQTLGEMLPRDLMICNSPQYRKQTLGEMLPRDLMICEGNRREWHWFAGLIEL